MSYRTYCTDRAVDQLRALPDGTRADAVRTIDALQAGDLSRSTVLLDTLRRTPMTDELDVWFIVDDEQRLLVVVSIGAPCVR